LTSEAEIVPILFISICRYPIIRIIYEIWRIGRSILKIGTGRNEPLPFYFFNFFNASASALFLKSSCFFIYLLMSFFETRRFCSFFLRSWNVESFSRWPHTHVNVCPSPSPYNFRRFLQFGQRAFVFL